MNLNMTIEALKEALLVPIETLREALLVLGIKGDNWKAQVSYLAEVSGPALTSYLRITQHDLKKLLALLGPPTDHLDEETRKRLKVLTFGYGVNVDHVVVGPSDVQPPNLSPDAVSKPSVNLINEMPQITDKHDQEGRLTCVAFSALAVLEHYFLVNGQPRDLSEQFLYWGCKTNDGAPNSPGTRLEIAFPFLAQDGCCLEATWPYVIIDIANNESQDPPPAGAQAQASGLLSPNSQWLDPNSVDGIKNELAAGHCVAISINLFPSWNGASGNIPMPAASEVIIGSHAVCLVGYDDIPGQGGAALGGGRFILRNTRGLDWPRIPTALGRGYGTIPYAYIQQHGKEAFTLF